MLAETDRDEIGLLQGNTMLYTALCDLLNGDDPILNAPTSGTGTLKES